LGAAISIPKMASW